MSGATQRIIRECSFRRPTFCGACWAMSSARKDVCVCSYQPTTFPGTWELGVRLRSGGTAALLYLVAEMIYGRLKSLTTLTIERNVRDKLNIEFGGPGIADMVAVTLGNTILRVVERRMQSQ
eukprot:11061399-Heterocapsa_arctica.AAC.1